MSHVTVSLCKKLLWLWLYDVKSFNLKLENKNLTIFDVFKFTRLRVAIELISRDSLIFVWFKVVVKKSAVSGSTIGLVCILTGWPIWSSSTVSHSLSSTVFKSAQLLNSILIPEIKNKEQPNFFHFLLFAFILHLRGPARYWAECDTNGAFISICVDFKYNWLITSRNYNWFWLDWRLVAC